MERRLPTAGRARKMQRQPAGPRTRTRAYYFLLATMGAACGQPQPALGPAGPAPAPRGPDGTAQLPQHPTSPASSAAGARQNAEPKEVWDIEAEQVTVAPEQWPPAPVPLVEPVAVVPVTPGDPKRGKFTIEQATEGLQGDRQLVARLVTDHGDIDCELWPHRAPRTVANFVGLARGLRPFKDPISKVWVTRPAYDRTVFHRIIAGFMIQGGDPIGTGTGKPGYVIPDENWEGATHNQPGLLCMATEGPNTGGMQFFVTDGALDRNLSYLDGSYTVFGQCLHTDVIASIARVKTYGDRPELPPRLERVEVFRRQSEASQAPGAASE